MSFLMSCLSITAFAQEQEVKEIPELLQTPTIDGDLSDWKEKAYNNGTWDLERIKKSSWYDPKRNRLNVDEGEDPAHIDLSSRYYMAWDDRYLYFGAEVTDNVNDVTESKHQLKRWYYKDAIAWFIEAPRDNKPAGRSSSAKSLCSCARAHRCWLRRAKASWSSRVTPNCRATFSAVSPMEYGWWRALSLGLMKRHPIDVS